MDTREELAWLQAQLARFTYKPGWTFEIEPPATSSFFDRPILRIRFDAPDARGGDKPVKIESRRPFPTVYDLIARDGDANLAQTTFARTLSHIIWDAEQHESQEWLRRDGAIYDDPHQTP